MHAQQHLESVTAYEDLPTEGKQIRCGSMRPTLRKLCDDTELLISLEGVQHLDDILVPEAP